MIEFNPHTAHAFSAETVLKNVESSVHGLNGQQIIERQSLHGKNSLPEGKTHHPVIIFLHQFLNPLIYILLLAAVIALVVGKYSDTAFILVVLIINALIGGFQEISAQKSASSLRKMVTQLAKVFRDGISQEIDARELVPGDIVFLESGDKVPADLRLIHQHDLLVDESLLTGESLSVSKEAERQLEKDTLLADRVNMTHAGTLITRGRATGVVTATGLNTQIGQIASGILTGESTKPPLIIRMERFTNRIGLWMGLVILLIGFVSFTRGMPLTDVMMIAIALAVAAIPEGLPVAMTVALSISMRRMSHRGVIIRRLVTVESLGSCTYIASDKTGTLTANELTIQKLILPDATEYNVSGVGITPEGTISSIDNSPPDDAHLQAICELTIAGVMANEGFLGVREGSWTHHGDSVDIAFLVLGHKLELDRPVLLENSVELDSIPYESSNMFSAMLVKRHDSKTIYVKGAVETLLEMCSHDVNSEISGKLASLEQEAHALANQGYRVLALASKTVTSDSIKHTDLHRLTFLGLVGIIDPLRESSAQAVKSCRDAGIRVAMITGDHPATALSIGQQLHIAKNNVQVVTGKELASIDEDELSQLVEQKTIFARIEPQQKTAVVHALQKIGHFVAVTGDGANDAPALSSAHIGVAMGKSGTDVARETADMIITDDNFSSIVAGVEEGRIAYANIRKVIFLLISTGAAEIVLFILSILSGLPLPLTAVQLLWLNLVTNGIQDIALAFEPGEGDELKHPPRPPNEPIFNRLMIKRVLLSSIVMGVLAYGAFYYFISTGLDVDSARNLVLLLMVLFENIHVFNSRSETKSVFGIRFFNNPFLIIGTIAAQLIHISSMYMGSLSGILQTQPVSLYQWLVLLCVALLLLLACELQKVQHKALLRTNS